MHKKKIVLGIIACLGVIITSPAQQILLSSEKLDELDATPSLARQTDVDRLSKQMLFGTSIEDSDLNRRTIVQSLSRMVEEDPTLPDTICYDLKLGDEYLSRALQESLMAMNVPSSNAFSIVEKWATYGPDETLRTLLSNIESSPDVASALSSYMEKASPDWIKLVRGISALVTGESEAGRLALATAIANATGQGVKAIGSSLDRVRAGDYGQLWNLTADAKKILTSRGSLAREILSQQDIKGSFYDKAWASLCNEVAVSDLVTKSYIARSSRLAPLLSSYKECLVVGLRTSGREALVAGIISGSSIPDSRFRWMAEELSEKNYATFSQELSVDRTARQLRSSVSDNLLDAVANDPFWTGVVLWHLTRPAEATALATRLSLTEALSSDPEFAREYIKRGAPLGQIVDQQAQSRGGYDYYPGGRVEMIKKTETGEVTRESLVQLSRAIAEVLAGDDRAWDSVVSPSGNQDWTRKLVLLGLERVPMVASNWAQTMVKNDRALGQGFSNWVMENKALVDDQQNAEAWISSIAASSSSAEAFGNAEVAKFKKMFAEYINTPQGWSLASNRLRLEGADFSTVVRELLVGVSVSNPDVFWKLFRILTAAEGDTMARLRPYLEEYISSSRLPQMILDETAAENAFAADAGSALWKVMLKPNSPTMNALANEMKNLRVKTEPHALGNLCFVEEISSTEGWKIAAPATPAMLEKIRSEGISLRGSTEKEQLVYALTNHADACGMIYQMMLDNKVFYEAWANRVITKVLFMGKAPSVAWLVKQKSELLKEWQAEIGKQTAADPYILRAFVDSLVTRRIGDQEWLSQVNTIRKEIATAVFYDRILVEQMLGFPEKEYRETLTEEIRRIFGEYVTDQWKDLSSD